MDRAMATSYSSGNSIHLMKYEVETIGKWFGSTSKLAQELDSAPLESLSTICFNKINLNSEEESSIDPSFINAFSGLIKGNRFLQLAEFASLFARVRASKIELYFKLTKDFMEELCSIFPHPVLHVQGNIELGLAKYPGPWSPHYSTPVDTYFYLKDILIASTTRETAHKSQLLDDSITLERICPLGTIKLKLVLDISFEWSGNLNIPIQIGADAIMKNMFENDSTKDFTIVAGDGAEVKCHGFVLAAHSPALSTMVSPANKMKDSQTRRIELKNMSEEGINHFLQYLYCRKIPSADLSSNVSLELFQTAHQYELHHLEEVMGQLFLRRSDGWFTPDMILELYFLIAKLDNFSRLQNHLLSLMKRMPTELQTSKRFPELDAADATELLWKLLQLK